MTDTSFPRTMRLIAVSAVALLAVTSCAEESQPSPEGQEEDPLAGFYDQSIQWEDCEDDRREQLRCAEVTVPLDYADPDGETLEIALAVHGEEGDPYVLANPGGPGASGVDIVTEDLETVATTELIENVNVVGFDPRGVHRSEGISCISDEDYEQARLTTEEADIDDDEAFETAVEETESLMTSCQEQHGDLLDNVDTVSAARDMDIIRAGLGDDELHYVGFSYGTKLGMAYAEEFPQNVGRFVLDAMMDVSLEADELSLAQAQGFEDALHDFADWCLENDCPVTGESEHVTEAVANMFAEVSAEPPIGDDERLINISTVVSGFITPMYSPEGWPVLRDALDAALNRQDFTAFQQFSDIQAGRNPDGSYDWFDTFAFSTIMCSDYEVATTQEAMEAESEALTEAAPTFGPYLGYDGIFCEALPGEPSGEPWQPSDDLPAMLFIGTTGDPATPVSWAEDMHAMVPTSSLMIYDGEGHTAYRPGADCVTEPVDEFLLDGELFEGRQDC